MTAACACVDELAEIPRGAGRGDLWPSPTAMAVFAGRAFITQAMAKCVNWGDKSSSVS